MYIHIYIYVYTYIYIFIYIYLSHSHVCHDSLMSLLCQITRVCMSESHHTKYRSLFRKRPIKETVFCKRDR